MLDHYATDDPFTAFEEEAEGDPPFWTQALLRKQVLLFALSAVSALAQSVAVVPPGSNTSMGSSGLVSQHQLVTVTVSQQPLAIFTIALGSKLTGIAGYSMRACSSSDFPSVVSGGKIAQLIEGRGVAVIPIGLAASAATEARINSKLYRTMQYTSEAGYYISLLMGANIIRIGTTANGVGTLAQRVSRLAPIIISHEAEKAKDALGARLPDPLTRFKGQVLDDSDVRLDPGACSTLVFMGAYQQGFTTLTGTVEAR